MDRPWRDEANGWVAVLRKARAVGLFANLELMTTARRAARRARPPLPAASRLPHRQRLRDRRAGGTRDAAAPTARLTRPQWRGRSTTCSRSAPCAGRRRTFPQGGVVGRTRRFAGGAGLGRPAGERHRRARTARATPSPPACFMGCMSNGRLSSVLSSDMRCAAACDARGVDNGRRWNGQRMPGAGEAMGIPAAGAR